jgi:hypothetical protein
LGKIEEPGKSSDALILEFEKQLLGVPEPGKDAAEDLDSEEEVQGPEKSSQNIGRSAQNVGILHWI